MRNIILLILATSFSLQSCQNGSEKKTTETKLITNSTKKDSLQVDTPIESEDTLKIKYSEHKNLLDILTKLPEHTMASWKWSESERIQFVKFIQENNFTFSASPSFLKFSLIGANSIGIQVVDGYWTLAIYKIKPTNYIVVTDDMVGDGNDIQAFEYKDGKLIEMDYMHLFDDMFLSHLLIHNNEECEDLLEDNLIGFEYDFTHTTYLTISNSHYLKENEHQNCLKGNTLNYKFNPLTKKFDLKAITWKKAEP